MAHALLPDPDALRLDSLALKGGVIVFHVATTAESAHCPYCDCQSDRPHSFYPRTLQDLPWQGNTVRFHLTVRRFFCDNRACSTKIFAQRVEAVARRYQRKTTRLDDLLLQLMWRLGAASTAAIARLLGLLQSADAILYRFKNATSPQPPQESPQVLAMDDFAFRRGKSYGTILLDLQTSTPIDLLPDREKSTVEKWLKDHPGAQIVSRDRSAVYAEAIREGAPEAIHVADRFHLLKNLLETLQAQVGKESKSIREALLPKADLADEQDEGPVPLTRRQQREREESRQRRFERWQQAHALFEAGYAKKEIARRMGLDINTVRMYLAAPTFPERQRHSPVNGPLSPYKEYLLSRWESGCQNALQLWREIRAKGYGGSATTVRDFVVPLRQPGRSVASRRVERLIPSTRNLSWLLALPARCSAAQTQLVETLCQACPTLSTSRELTLSFYDMMRRRAVDELDGWLERASASGLSAFATFVRGIRSDYAAVSAAFSLEWSNGPTEGHVNRLKFIKRQGYGRAGFELLRRRVLPLPI